MMDFESDLAAVFFGPPFAFPFARQRPSVADVEVWVIVGMEDDEVLEARAMATRRMAHFAAGKDVRAGDLLMALQRVSGEVPMGTRFEVLEPPRRVNDGLELEALLGSVRA